MDREQETAARSRDREMFEAMSKDRLVDLIFMYVRSIFSVDGLYYIGIEERFDTGTATDVDAFCWRVMGKLDCRRTREVTGLEGEDLATLEKLVRLCTWAVDLEDKEIVLEEDRLVIRVRACRVQLTRREKGLPEFNCRVVREGYMEAFAREFGGGVRVECLVCPPGDHPEDLWCEWVFTRG